MKHRFPEMIDTYINGNQKEFRNFIGFLSKKELIELLIFWPEYTGQSIDQAIAEIKKCV
jgi:hypothetical protein